jgi:enoyl-CoA hydratase/carnithine racemase
VNRALPDAELDGFVDALATRIASFDRTAVVETKKLVNLASLPPDSEMTPNWNAFISTVQRPAAQERVGALVKQGLQKDPSIYQDLGKRTAAFKK